MKEFFKKYAHALPVIIYMAIYLIWFFLLENHVTTYKIIHTSVDDKIPFIEFFVIPYYMWFVYVAACVAIAFFTDREEYFRSLVFLMTGMTVFLIISTIWPNGHNLRPLIMPRDNLCSRMVTRLYSTDTPTNLWPSIHVYNSLGAHLCITHCKFSRDKKVITVPSLIICVSIILSTMFIKQHSLFDVFTAFLMALLMTIIVYRKEIRMRIERARERIRSDQRFVFK